MANQITFKMGVDGSGFVSGAESAFQSAALKARLMGDAIVATLKGAMSLAASTIEKSLGEAFEARAAVDKLNVSLNRIGTSFEQNQAKIESWGKNLSRAFGVDDEDAMAGISQLVDAGMSLNEAMARGTELADIAAKKNMSMADAAKVVGLAYQGNLRGLREFGISLKSTGDIAKDAEMAQRKLAEITAGGAALKAQRDPFSLMKTSFENMLEGMGEKMLGVLMPVITRLNNVFTGLVESGKFEEFLNGFQRWFEFVVGYVENLFKSIDPNNLGSSFMNIVKEAGSFILDIVKVAGNILGLEMRKHLPKMLGGGLSATEEAELEASTMTEEQRAARAKQLRAQEASARANGGDWFGQEKGNKFGNQAMVFEGQGTGMDTLSDVMGRHTFNAFQMANKPSAGPSFFQQMEALGARSNAASLAAASGMQADHTQVSAAALSAQREESRKKARAEILKSEQDRGRAAIQLQSPMRLQVSKVGGMHRSRGGHR